MTAVVSAIGNLVMDELDGRRSRYVSSARPMSWQKEERSENDGQRHC
jgi:hypothetical protein